MTVTVVTVLSKMKWILIFCFLKWIQGSEIPYEQEEQDVTGRTFLFTTRYGMQFRKHTDDKMALNIIYDCSIGLQDEGIINVFDNLHPNNIETLLVKNCRNVTISCSLENRNYEWLYSLPTLVVKNVKTARLELKGNDGEEKYQRHYEYSSSISCPDIVALVLVNVGIQSLKVTRLNNLTMRGVTMKDVNRNSVIIKGGRNSEMIIEDSYFGKVERNSFFGNVSRVKIFNNSFSNIESQAFEIPASDFFTFSHNFVGKISDSFQVESSKIEITWNTFDVEEDSWTRHLKSSNRSNGFQVLNISHNKMNTVSGSFFSASPDCNPDQVILENNYLNCTCRSWNLFNDDISPKNKLKYLFFKSPNFCVNLGNCTVNKVLGKVNDVCLNRFVCEHQLEQENSNPTEYYFESILSSLKNISEILSRIADGHNVVMQSPSQEFPSTELEPAVANNSIKLN